VSIAVVATNIDLVDDVVGYPDVLTASVLGGVDGELAGWLRRYGEY
jgi:hypothetical protein